MVTFRRILVCLAAALVTWGMSHQTPAHESDEDEASEHHGSHDEGSEHNESHNEGSEHSGTSNRSSSSGSSSSTRGSDNDDRNGRGSSRDDSSRGTSTTTTARTTTTATRNASTSATASSRTSAASRSDRGTERKARLRSFVGGRGSAEYKSSGTNRSFEVELESASLSPGQTLSVCVNDVSVGAMTVMLSGRRTKAKLKLETRRGHAVPTISAGSVVTIKLTTATIATGTF